MTTPESDLHLYLHKPNPLKILGEWIGLYQIRPDDITSERGREILFEIYDDLAGDKNIGPGDDGNCQSWRGNRYWWKKML